MAAPLPPSLCPSAHIAIIEVEGSDAESFMNAQFSRDVPAPGASHANLTAWHDAGGRVLAILTVFHRDERWFLLAHTTRGSELVRRLSLYVLRADVRLMETTKDWQVLSAVGNLDAWLTERGAAPTGAPRETLRIGSMSVVRVSPEFAYILTPVDTETTNLTGLDGNSEDAQLAELRLGLLNLSPELGGRFTPQMLNLDRAGAIAFDKGCYPGQEVIARIENLGKAKRRLYRFAGSLEQSPAEGTTLQDNEGRGVGEVVRSARDRDASVEILAVVETAAADGELTCVAEPDVALTQQPLPLSEL